MHVPSYGSCAIAHLPISLMFRVLSVLPNTVEYCSIIWNCLILQLRASSTRESVYLMAAEVNPTKLKINIVQNCPLGVDS